MNLTARGADRAIKNTVDAHVEAERGKDEGPASAGPFGLMARKIETDSERSRSRSRTLVLTCTGVRRAGDRDRTGMTSLEGFGPHPADQRPRRSGHTPLSPCMTVSPCCSPS
jgi:hypothetical protein